MLHIVPSELCLKRSAYPELFQFLSRKILEPGMRFQLISSARMSQSVISPPDEQTIDEIYTVLRNSSGGQQSLGNFCLSASHLILHFLVRVTRVRSLSNQTFEQHCAK